MADPAIGGAILGEACHFVDLMYWLLDSEPRRASRRTRLPTGKAGSDRGKQHRGGSFHFADGSIGNLTYCTVGSKTSGGERVEGFAQGIGVATENFKKLTIQSAIRKLGRAGFGRKKDMPRNWKLYRRHPERDGPGSNCSRWRALHHWDACKCWNRPGSGATPDRS